MREPDFNGFRARLLNGGVAPRHVRRTIIELRDHYQDLVDEGEDCGLSGGEARRTAMARLGSLDDVAHGLLACRDLRSWAYRYPGLAVLVYPVACLAALPLVPIRAGLERAPLLARWGVSLLLAGLVTATMMLVLQLSIRLG